MVSRWTALWTALVDLVAAAECGGCGRPPREKSVLCGRCGHALLPERLHRAGLARGLSKAGGPAPVTMAVALYGDPVRTMIIRYKERGRTDLAKPLGAALARAVAEVGGPGGSGGIGGSAVVSVAGLVAGPATTAVDLVIVPMPSTRQAVRRRGVDSTARLARVVAAELRSAGVPARTAPVLRHARRVADQAGLDTAGRVANLAGALTIPPRLLRHLDGARVVLVDDVVTSGATLVEGARVVRLAGARVLGAAVVAAARFAD